MRAATVTLTVFALTCLTGAQCQWLRTDKPAAPPPGTPPLKEYDAGALVTYLNEQAACMKSVQYDRVGLRASEAGNDMPKLGSGELVCAQPRNFRLKAGTMVTGTELDMGSNENEFWMYVKRGEPGSTYVYSSHEDFAQGKARLPFPFDTSWVMQALGMSRFEPTAGYVVDVNQKDRSYTLTWNDRTPQGQEVRKTIVIAGEKARGGKPQVLQHIVMDTNGGVITKADVKQVQEVPVARANDGVIQVPTHVVLEWPQQKFKMDLTLDKVKVNEPLTDKLMAYYFDRPADIGGAKPENLAGDRFRPSSYRGATPDIGYRQRTFGGR